MSRIASTPLIEGLAFDTGPESLHAVQDYALSTGKAVRIERASGSDRRIVCASKEPCPFVVQVYRQRHSDKTYGKWYIASLNLQHSEACSSQLKVTTRQIADLPAFAEAVHANPKAKIESLIALVEQRYGLSLAKQKRLVYRARDMVKQGNPGRGNILDSEDSPLPPRQFVRRRRWERKEQQSTPPGKAERMVWLDVFVDTLLTERLKKRGQEFVDATTQKQRRDLWADIQQAFNATHNMSLSADQLRVKFRLLRDEYTRTRAQEEEATQHPDTAVVYPRRWDVLVRYFGENAGQNSEAEGQEADDPDNVEVYDGEAEEEETLSNAEASEVIQTESTPGLQAGPSSKRRRLDMSASPNGLQDQPAASLIPEQFPVTLLVPDQAPAASIAADQAPSTLVHERLDSIQNLQQEMVRSMTGMQQAVQQSTEVMRGLQQALDQSNQVNAALLDFLKRTPH